MREKEFLPLVKERLGIEELNEMQRKMMEEATKPCDIILLSPTGSGKTLAFILPMLKMLKPSTGRVQSVIIAPSRELVIQIAGIVGSIASGFKTTVLYGGHKVEDEVNSLSAGTDIIVATPGRLLDHINRRNIDVLPTRIFVLDEFDKSLELGFEKEMKKISGHLKNVSRMILTSATRADVLPSFLNLRNPVTLDYLYSGDGPRSRMRVHRVDSDSNDKLASLSRLLKWLASESGSWERSIIFVNHRESAERTYQYLKKTGIPAVLYHGAIDQREREQAVAMFNNGSRPVMVATDLAARGLDIKNVKSIVHYHQPLTEETYTHRNGRTARVDADGDVYVLVGPQEDVKEYVEFDRTLYPGESAYEGEAEFETIYFSAGKKEKLSRGDILGFLTKECGVPGESIGKIDVYDHYSLAAVKKKEADSLAPLLKGKKIKGEKRIISIIG